MFYTKDKRYAVELDMYITADNDYHARMISAELRPELCRYHVDIKSIVDAPFASFITRKLDDISEPTKDKMPF